MVICYMFVYISLYLYTSVFYVLCVYTQVFGLQSPELCCLPFRNLDSPWTGMENLETLPLSLVGGRGSPVTVKKTHKKFPSVPGEYSQFQDQSGELHYNFHRFLSTSSSFTLLLRISSGSPYKIRKGFSGYFKMKKKSHFY